MKIQQNNVNRTKQKRKLQLPSKHYLNHHCHNVKFVMTIAAKETKFQGNGNCGTV